MKFIPVLLLLCSCSIISNPSKMMGLGEDIIDDIVEAETGVELNLGPEHQNDD